MSDEKKWEDKIDEFLKERRDEIIDQVSKLVRIESIASEAEGIYPYGKACAKGLDFCAELAEENGLFVCNYDYYGVEIRPWEKVEDKSKRLLLATHVDVVPASENNSYPAFGGVVDKGYIIGRGVVDDKGPLIALLYALIFLKEQEVMLSSDVRLFVGSHEETDMEDLKYYLDRVGQPDFGLVADDDFPITNGEKSLLKVRVHMSLDRNDKSKEFFEELLKDRDGTIFGLQICSEQYGNTTCRVQEETLEECGTVFIKKCVLIDIRIPVCQDLQNAKEKIICSLKEKTGHEVSLEVVREDPGYYISDKDGIPRILIDLYNEVSDADDESYIMEGCTYARCFKRGCGFGAGNPHEVKPFGKGRGSAHGSDEAHNIEVLLHAVKMDILGIIAIAEFWDREKCVIVSENI